MHRVRKSPKTEHVFDVLLDYNVFNVYNKYSKYNKHRKPKGKNDQMSNEDFIAVNALLAKYEAALSMCLYPSQSENLREALADWMHEEKIIEIDDAFTRLAFMMIVCAELHDQTEARKGAQK